MATKPTTKPEWATGGTIAEPSGAKKILGWIKEKVPFQWLNWLFNLIYQWVVYFDLETDLIKLYRNEPVLRAQSPATMTVDVLGGTYGANRFKTTIADTSVLISSAGIPGGQSRIDLILADEFQLVYVFPGTPAVTPKIPSISRREYIIGAVVVNSGDTSIPASQVFSKFLQDTHGFLEKTLYVPIATSQTGLNVDVSAGTYRHSNERKTYAGGTVALGAAPGSNSRLDLITLDAAGTLAVVAGTDAANPVPPPSGFNWVVAIVRIVAAQTQLTAADILTPVNSFGSASVYDDEFFASLRSIKPNDGDLYIDYLNNKLFDGTTDGMRSGRLTGAPFALSPVEAGVITTDRNFLYRAADRLFEFAEGLRIRKFGVSDVIPSIVNYVHGSPETASTVTISFGFGAGNDTHFTILVSANFANQSPGSNQSASIIFDNTAADGLTIFEPSGPVTNTVTFSDVQQDATESMQMFVMMRMRRTAATQTHQIHIDPGAAQNLMKYSVIILRSQ